MKARSKKLIAAVALAIGCLGVSSASGAFLVYKNTFTRKSEILQLRHLFVPGAGTHCKRAHIAHQMRVTVGRSTTECDFSPPVVADSDSNGGNFNVAVTATLSKTSALKKKTFMSVGVRVSEAGGGSSKYRLDVSPAAKRFALRKYVGGEKAAQVPTTRILAQGVRKFINGTGVPNRIGIGVLDTGAGASIVANINGKLIANPVDPAPLSGHITEIAIGRATGPATGAAGSFDTLGIQASP